MPASEPAQIAWYEATSARIEQEAGRKPNALMFFHVPLHEFAEAVEAGCPLTGFRLEDECPARDNAGMFDAVLHRGDVCGIFAGHDHANNYVTEYRGVALGFGRYSGTFGEYQELLSGARMFEPQGRRAGIHDMGSGWPTTAWPVVARSRRRNPRTNKTTAAMSSKRSLRTAGIAVSIAFLALAVLSSTDVLPPRGSSARCSSCSAPCSGAGC